jgi:hypothetical protein
MDQNTKTQVLHINRLKLAHNTDSWKPQPRRIAKKKTRRKEKALAEEEFRTRSLPMQVPNITPCVQTPNTLDPMQQVDETPS